jgi:ribosomal protein L34E
MENKQKTIEILVNSNFSGEQHVVGYGSLDPDDPATFSKLEKTVERYYPGMIANIRIVDENIIKIMRANSTIVECNVEP